MQQARDGQLMGGGCTAERIGFTAARLAVQCGLLMAARRMLTSGSAQANSLQISHAGLTGALQTSKAGGEGRAESSPSQAAAYEADGEAEIDSAQLAASSASSCGLDQQLLMSSGPQQHRQAAAGSSSKAGHSVSGHWPAGKGSRSTSSSLGSSRFDPLPQQQGWLRGSRARAGEGPLVEGSRTSSGAPWWAPVQELGWCALLACLCTPALLLVSG
jgi:hypothetical protein